MKNLVQTSAKYYLAPLVLKQKFTWSYKTCFDMASRPIFPLAERYELTGVSKLKLLKMELGAVAVTWAMVMPLVVEAVVEALQVED